MSNIETTVKLFGDFERHSEALERIQIASSKEGFGARVEALILRGNNREVQLGYSLAPEAIR